MSSAHLRLLPARSVRGIAIVAAVAVALLAVNTGVADALPLTSLTTESFTGATTVDSGWTLPSAASNGACLSAGTSTSQTPIKACSTTAIDTAGQGTLRLTSNANSKVGTIYNSTSLPTAQGLDIKFNSYQWNSTSNPGADGISFILAATDPSDPAPPAATGPLGGSLGYSATKSTATGVTNGYLGFGLDVYGNYQSSNFGGTDCATSAATPQSITVRGPGNANAGYCILGTTVVSAGALDARTSTTRPTAVPVEIVLNPGAATTTSGGLAVNASSWTIRATPIGGSAQTLTGSLPSAATLATYGYPASFYDPSTGLPYQLTFGWAASTGGNNEIHEINTLQSGTLNGQLPAFRLAVADNQSGNFIAGNSATVSVTPSLDAAEGNEANPLTVTTTIPAGLTPGSVTSSDYSCSTAGQTVTCTYTPTGTISAGTTLPAIAIPVSVGTTPASYTITAKVSSNDANPATASHTVSSTAFAASATPASISYGGLSTLAATGLPANATGTVTFASGGTTLCSAAAPSASCTTSTTLPAANYPIVATYSGDGAYASQTASTALAVAQAATAITAAVSDPSIEYGTPDTLSVSGTPAGAGGTVTFASGATTLCSVTLPATSCQSPVSLVPASYPVTATYSGDGNHVGSANTTSFVVTKAATGITAAVSDPSVAFGTPDTVSATGLPVDATGTIAFTSGPTTLCTATLPASSCATPAALLTGSYPVTATYSGDSNYTASSDGTIFDVLKADTGVIAGVSDPSVSFGSADTLAFSGLPVGASGTVTFTSGGVTLCTATLPAVSCASPADLDAATYPVTAVYSGDANHNGSSDTTSFTVSKLVLDAFTASSTPASTTYGESDTLSFSGVPAGGTGTVTFSSGGTTLCTATLPASSCTTPSALVTGSYPVTASYSGDGNHAAATAGTTFDVTKAGTALVAAAGAPSTEYGTPETLSYSGVPTGATGTVTFTSGGTTLCTATLPATSCDTSVLLDTGSYPVSATYSGDDNHDGSSDTSTFDVVKARQTLTAAPASPILTYGQAQTLTFSGLAGAATGTVSFSSGGTALCTATLPATSCTVPAGLNAAQYPVTAAYSGDDHYAATSAATAFGVDKASTSITAQASTSKASQGQTVMLTGTGLPSGASGKITFTSGGKQLCTATLPATSCSAPTDLATGDYPVTAVYSGDGNHSGSSDTTSFTVVAVAKVGTAAATRSGTTSTITIPGASGAHSLSITNPPAHGTAKIVNGKLVYTPTDGFAGTDTITIRIVHADGSISLVTVTVDVQAPSGEASTPLAFTGASILLPLAVGAGLLVIGSTAVMVTRRGKAAG
jgi:hypothetical protein